MPISEEHMRYGSWTVELKPDTPQHVLDLFRVKNPDNDGFLGHIVITAKDYEDVDEIDVLAEARYAGPLRAYEFSKDQKVISGLGMVYWLGEQTDEGPGMDKTPIDLTGQTFITALTNALSGSGIVAGNIIAESGALPAGRYYLNTTRYKVEDICSQYGSGSETAEYVVTPQGKLDAGTPAALFPSYNDPKVFIKRKGGQADPVYKSLGLANADMGAQDHTLTEKLLARLEDEQAVISGQATQVTSKRTINNTLVSRTSVSGESQEDPDTANARAAALLAIQGKTRKTSTLSTDKFDIDTGKLRLGERVLVWDPESGHIDPNNEHEFNGEIYWPSKEVVVGLSWPLAIQEDGSKPGVFFRETFDGKMHRITDYVAWEANLQEDPDSGVVDVEVASSPRSLIKQTNTPLGSIRSPETNPQEPPPAPDPPTVASDERQFYVTVPTTGFPLSVTKVKIYAAETSGFTVDSTTYRWDIPVSRGNILLGQTVKGRVPWPAENVFVRASAVNNQEGPASAEVTTTVPLIPSLAILSLIADKIDAGTISASIEILSPTITGGLFRTSVTGERIEMAEGTPDQVRWFSGLASESSNAFSSSNSALAGGGRIAWATRSAVSTARAGESVVWLASGGSSDNAAAELQAYDSVSSPTWFSRLSVTRNQAWLYAIDPAGTFNDAAGIFIDNSNPQFRLAVDSRRLSLGSTFAALYYGNTSTDPRVEVRADRAALFFGDSDLASRIIALTDRAELAYRSLGRRLYVDVDRARIVGSDNVAKFDVENDRINCFQGLAMNQWDLWMGAAGSVTRISGDASAISLLGDTRARLSVNIDNTQLRVGNLATTDADLVDNAGTVYRIFKADVVDQCDSALKERRGVAPDSLRDVLAMDFGLFVRKGRPNDAPIIGFGAEFAPEYLTSPSDVMTGKGKARRPMRGMKPNAGIAWLGKALQELYAEVDERLKSLEGAE